MWKKQLSNLCLWVDLQCTLSVAYMNLLKNKLTVMTHHLHARFIYFSKKLQTETHQNPSTTGDVIALQVY